MFSSGIFSYHLLFPPLSCSLFWNSYYPHTRYSGDFPPNFLNNYFLFLDIFAFYCTFRDLPVSSKNFNLAVTFLIFMRSSSQFSLYFFIQVNFVCSIDNLFSYLFEANIIFSYLALPLPLLNYFSSFILVLLTFESYIPKKLTQSFMYEWGLLIDILPYECLFH